MLFGYYINFLFRNEKKEGESEAQRGVELDCLTLTLAAQYLLYKFPHVTAVGPAGT